MSDQTALLVDAVGPSTTIQDAGRFGLLRFGVTPAGPMDPVALRTANLALGNPPGAAGVEVGPGGIVLTCEHPAILAYAGGAFRWTREDQELPPAARVALRRGERLRARAGAWGQWCYLAVPGGVDVPPVMGSRATHTRSALGGFEGRVLAAGDRIKAAGGPVSGSDDAAIDAGWLKADDAAVRVVLGPQEDHFTPEAVATFLESRWSVTAAADRMAYALDGPRLAHACGFNIVSDGVALGAVQVSGDGKPLVLMADRQPTGGYPKIAHVARVDIGRLAQLRPGQSLRFEAVPVEAARQAMLDLEASTDDLRRYLSPLRRRPSQTRLSESNLIDGVTDGRD